jgi:hypothetical protein
MRSVAASAGVKGDVGALAAAARRARPVTTAAERALPVAPPLEPLLPSGLRRGTSLQVTGVRDGLGTTSLALAVLVGPSAAGSWVAAVGVPSLGLAAAAGFGVDLGRVVLVPDAGDPGGPTWSTVVATLLESFDVVVVRPHRRVPPGESRRLAARARERGSVLVRLGVPGDWPEAADAVLTVTSTTWEGLGHGSGHLRARRAVVEVGGRRGYDRPRSTTLWLPGPGGVLATAPAEARPVVEPVVLPLRLEAAS